MAKFQQQFLGSWSDVDDLVRDFGDESILDYTILVACYDCGAYEGDAYVLAEKDGRLFEVSGGHCSCYGLEGQWEPGEVTIAYLKYRLERGGFSYSGVTEAVQSYVDHVLFIQALPGVKRYFSN